VELKLLKSLWGMEGDIDAQLKQVAEAGYSGIEASMPPVEDESRMKELLKHYNLDLILHVYSGNEDNMKPYPNSVEMHIVTFEEQVERAKSFNPILINSQSAKDSMPYDDQLLFFEKAIEIEKRVGIPIGHETHRGRATFTPWNTARLLKDLPQLHITADFSHWCNVCESTLQDQEENILLATQHTIHTHGRIGFEQGPQVPDFRAPEYEYLLIQHEKWWDMIIAHHHNKGNPYFLFTPEFGPPGYMHTQPYTQQPVVDLWEICYAMSQRFSTRFHDVNQRRIPIN